MNTQVSKGLVNQPGDKEREEEKNERSLDKEKEATKSEKKGIS